MRVCLLALLSGTFIACSGDRPARFDMYTLGASFRETDSIARHVDARVFLCLPDVGTYRECWLQSPHNYRFTILTIDPEDRVVLIRQKLDSAEFRKRALGAVSTQAKHEFLTAQWSKLAEKRSVVPGPPAVETWAPPGRSWTALMVTDKLEGTNYLSEIVVREKDTRDYLDARTALIPDSIDMARVTNSTSPLVRGMRDELVRVTTVQRVHKEAAGHFGASLQQLHFMPNAEYLVKIGSGGPDGWWARIQQRAGDATVCYVWYGAPPEPLHVRARAGTIPEMPYCRSVAVQPETEPAPAEPSRRKRNNDLQSCPSDLDALRARDPVDTNPPGAVAHPAGVFTTAGLQDAPQHGRIISLWQVGRRWGGTTQILIGQPEPIAGIISDAYSTEDGSSRFRVVYDDGVFDSYHVVIGNDMLQGRVITAHRRCPGKILALENISLVRDVNASASQPAVPPR